MTPDSSPTERRTEFLEKVTPLVDQIGVDLLMLGDNVADLAGLVQVIEEFGKVKALAKETVEEPSYQVCFALEELLSGLLCEKHDNPAAVMEFVNDAFGALKKHVEALGTESAPPESMRAAIEVAFQMIDAPVIELGGRIRAAVVVEVEEPGPETAAGETASAEEPAPSDAARRDRTPAAAPPPPGTELCEEEASTGLPEAFDDMELYREFVFECNEHLETIEDRILSLEDNPDDSDLINEVFRPIHSMKGGAGFLSLTGMNRLAHDTETLLDRCRKREVPVTSYLVELCLRSVDALKQMIANLNEAVSSSDPIGAKDALPVVFFAPIRSDIQAYLENPEAALEARSDEASPEPRGAGEQETPEPEPAWQDAQTAFDADLADEPEEPTERLGEMLVKSGAAKSEDIDSALDLQESPLGEILVRTGAASEDAVNQALTAQRERSGAHGPSAIKVDTEKIDLLVNLVGELVIIEAQVAQMSQAISIATGMAPSAATDEDGSSNGSAKRDEGAARLLEKNLSQLGKITKELQDRSMALRMMPIRQTFQKMTRLVRDASRKVNKKVNLVITGEDTELDKTVVEQIGDPLVHMIRNCIDHGIEAPEARREAGKPETGTVNLDAYYLGDQIVIRVRDDGKGLDRGRIIEKAVENGLLNPGEQPPDSEVYNLIFAPGFSTAKEITDISGRGVGMDVVKRNIERLRGRVEVSSEKGRGTTITVSLPLTLAIIDGMVVRVGQEEYIIPTNSIRESLRPERRQMSTVKKRGEMVNVRGSLIPLVRLHDLWAIETGKTDPCEALVVIVESDSKQGCLLVDELVGQQQIVIKNLGEHFGEVRGLAGATILGNGRVGLIMDVDGVLATALG